MSGLDGLHIWQMSATDRTVCNNTIVITESTTSPRSSWILPSANSEDTTNTACSKTKTWFRQNHLSVDIFQDYWVLSIPFISWLLSRQMGSFKTIHQLTSLKTIGFFQDHLSVGFFQDHKVFQDHSSIDFFQDHCIL